MNVTVLDVLGDVCPVPLMKSKAAVGQLPHGHELLVLTDFPRAVRNITTWCNREGHSYEIEELASGSWQIRIRKR